MEKKWSLQIPEELESYRTEIERTVKPYIAIKTDKRKTSLWESKFAGHPYLPKTMEHPKDAEGNFMLLLVQLNFGELPPLEPMPKQGILQFFIPADDDVMGIDFDNMTNQANFRIVYHKTVEKDESLLVTDFSYLNGLDAEYFPVPNEMGLTFSICHEPVSVADFRMDGMLGEDVDLSVMITQGEEEKELFEVYEETFAGDGHKIGGYPFFTQTDPRDEDDEYEEYEVLLFQMDSDTEADIMWGDMGVANFFIKEKDLRNLDFSDVLYNWDCH